MKYTHTWGDTKQCPNWGIIGSKKKSKMKFKNSIIELKGRHNVTKSIEHNEGSLKRNDYSANWQHKRLKSSQMT